MNFNIVDKQSEDDFQHLLTLINLRKNGVVSDAMTQAGLIYKKNYGASIVDLRKLAVEYPNQNILAKMLWNHGWRETYILASLIADPKTLRMETLNSWFATIPTTEISEQLGNNLLARMDDPVLFNDLLSMEDNLVCIAVFKAFARQFMLKNFLMKDTFIAALTMDLGKSSLHQKSLANALGQALAFFVRKEVSYVSSFKEYLDRLIAVSDVFVLSKSILLTELEYL